MTNFLINIKNHYLRVAIAELVDEAMKTYGDQSISFLNNGTRMGWRKLM
jgi:hypothetical protein